MKFRSTKQSIKRFLFTISLFAIALFTLLRLLDLEKAKKSRVLNTNGTALFLENLFGTDDDILPDNSFFFLETTRMRKPNKERNLNLRQICSIESAALTNSNARIFVILVAPFVLTKAIKFTPQLRAILDYTNVYFKSMHLVQYTIDTPLEHFIANGSIFKSRFIRAHTADALRLLFLWKFGGTYLDMDMVVQQNLSAMPSNFICRDHGFLCNAIMNMKGKVGRKFAKMFMDDFIENFNPLEWSENGPFMLARVLSKVCGTKNVRKMNDCDGFRVLDDEVCYPITGLQWQYMFDDSYGETVVNLTRNSVVVHFWNKLSHIQKLKCNSTSAYLRIAREFCPKTMEFCTDYF
jgi:lactosylceramide 4-alpha-galactosyltransferase